MSASSLLLGIMALSMTSCGGDSATDKSSATQAPTATSADGATTTSSINIRYIDGDSVLAHYQLAKDLQEATMRAVQRIDNARNSKGTEIQKFAASIQQKAQSNGYLTEASCRSSRKCSRMLKTISPASVAMPTTSSHSSRSSSTTP